MTDVEDVTHRVEGDMSGDAGDSPKTIGPLLQEARMVKGLTIEAAADASKVPLSFVRLLEQEQFHLVPDFLYLTRFLTEYAAFLGLDSKQLLAQLKTQVISSRVREVPHPSSSIGAQLDTRRLLIYLLPAVVVIPLIFIGLSLFSGPSPTPPPAHQSEPPVETVTPTPEATTVVPSGPQGASPGQERPIAPITPQQQVVAPQIQQPQLQSARYTLRAEAKDTTWISLSADGAPLKGVLMRPGETLQWSANNRFVVTIGNIKGVAVSLNGRPIALKADSGLVIRNLVLPTEGGPPAGQ